MAYTALETQVHGSTNLTRAEVVDLFDNLRWFYTPPAYRLYDANAGETITTTLAVLNWANGHYEWREGGGGDPNNGTYNTGTSGDYVNVGDVAAGVWLNGVMISIEQAPDATYTFRRVQLRRGTGVAWTELADDTVRADETNRRTSIHIHGVGTFSASTDRVEARGRSAGGSLDVLTDRRWGVRFGSESALGDPYAVARHQSDQNDELRDTYNAIAANQLRIERRPSGQRYKSDGNQSISANTQTLVTLGSTDWDTDTGMAPVGSFPNLVIAQSTGLFFVSGQVTYDGFNSGTSFASVSILRDATTALTSANAPDQASGVSADATVAVSDLVPLNAGQYVSMYTTTGAASTVQSSRGTQLHATLLSSSSGVSPDRQKFGRMPHPDTWPDLANMSSSQLPVGTLRVASDLTDRMWHRPAFKCSLADDVEVDANAGWVDIDCDNIVFDYTDLEAEFGYRVFGSGGITLPWAGLWLVGARLELSPTSAEGTNRGANGTRGMRIAVGDRAVGAVLGRAMNASTHGWARTIAETVVINRDEGQDIKLQGLVTSTTDAFGAAVATSAHLWAVELGEGITRVPR
jgi:hypothetical protein